MDRRARTTGDETAPNDELVPNGWSVVDFDPQFNEVNDYRPWCSERTPEADDGTP